jgi:hypothetical protein
MLTVSVASTPCPPPRLAAAAGRQAAQITRRHAPQHAVAPRHSRPTWGTRDGRRTCRRGLYASSNGHADGDAAADIAAEQQQSQQQPEQQQADPPPAALPGRAAAPPPSKASLIFTILVVTVTAVANRVLYKVREGQPGDPCPLATAEKRIRPQPPRLLTDSTHAPLLPFAAADVSGASRQLCLLPRAAADFWLPSGLLRSAGSAVQASTVLLFGSRHTAALRRCLSVAATDSWSHPLPSFHPCRSGQVSKAMLAFPMRAPGMFLAIGLVEALSSLLGFLGAANLPGDCPCSCA